MTHRTFTACAIVAAALTAGSVAACNDASAPDNAPWYVGTWEATTANNAPLPFRYFNFGLPYTVDTMRLTITGQQFVESRLVLHGTKTDAATRSVVANPYSRAVLVAGYQDSVVIITGDDGIPGSVYMHFDRRGENLILPGWVGAEWKLVKRR